MDKIKIFYWAPFINKVATIRAVINSVTAIKNYSKNKYQANIIDVFGEWKKYDSSELKKSDYYELNYLNFLFKFRSEGFLKSRIKYVIIFILSFFSLTKLLKKNKPDYLIIHLITSLPLFLNLIFNFRTKFILRISGKPKLNIIRFLFWKSALKKIYKITFPTQETLEYFENLKIVDKKKLFLLYDPILNIKKINLKKKINIENNVAKKNDFYLSIGRLTKQKNFKFLIKCFQNIILKKPQTKLIIIGEGEQKDILKKMIQEYKVEKNIYLLGYKENIFNYLFNCKAFILSSLWEDPGFVLVEAISCNAPIISSDCSSGPKEIVGNDKGILFKSDSMEDFINKFLYFENKNLKEIKNYKVRAKKFVKKFTLLSHYKEIEKIIY